MTDFWQLLHLDPVTTKTLETTTSSWQGQPLHGQHMGGVQEALVTQCMEWYVKQRQSQPETRFARRFTFAAMVWKQNLLLERSKPLQNKSLSREHTHVIALRFMSVHFLHGCADIDELNMHRVAETWDVRKNLITLQDSWVSMSLTFVFTDFTDTGFHAWERRNRWLGSY